MEDLPIFYTQEELNEIECEIELHLLSEKILITESDSGMTENCKITAAIVKHARDSGFIDIANTYIKYPPFMFYTNSSNTVIRRIYGLMVVDNNEIRAHAVTAMFVMNNDIVGGVPVDELVRVKQWSQSQLDKLNSGMVLCKEAFLTPMGFRYFLK